MHKKCTILQEKILSLLAESGGELVAGSRKLCAQLNCSRDQIRYALDNLCAEDKIEIVQPTENGKSRKILLLQQQASACATAYSKDGMAHSKVIHKHVTVFDPYAQGPGEKFKIPGEKFNNALNIPGEKFKIPGEKFKSSSNILYCSRARIIYNNNIYNIILNNNIYNNKKTSKENDKKEKPLVFDDDFERLWKAYVVATPKGSKPEAKKEFMKLKPNAELVETMIGALQAQLAQDKVKVSRKLFVEAHPHLVRWLRHKRWTDELATTEQLEAAVKQALPNRPEHLKAQDVSSVMADAYSRPKAPEAPRIDNATWEEKMRKDYGDAYLKMVDKINFAKQKII